MQKENFLSKCGSSVEQFVTQCPLYRVSECCCWFLNVCLLFLINTLATVILLYLVKCCSFILLNSSFHVPFSSKLKPHQRHHLSRLWRWQVSCSTFLCRWSRFSSGVWLQIQTWRTPAWPELFAGTCGATTGSVTDLRGGYIFFSQ